MIKSPCNKICRIDHKKNICIGCGRSLKEISEWIYLNNDEKKKILLRLQNIFKYN